MERIEYGLTVIYHPAILFECGTESRSESGRNVNFRGFSEAIEYGQSARGIQAYGSVYGKGFDQVAFQVVIC